MVQVAQQISARGVEECKSVEIGQHLLETFACTCIQRLPKKDEHGCLSPYNERARTWCGSVHDATRMRPMPQDLLATVLVLTMAPIMREE